MTNRPGVTHPSLLDALVPLVALAVLIASALALFGLDALDGPIQVALLLCCAVAALIAMKNGHPFSTVQEAGRGGGTSPALSVLYGFTGFKIEHITPERTAPSEDTS